MIPETLHFVWVGGPMPDWARQHVEAFTRLNPDRTVRVHGDDSLDPALLPAYQKATDLRIKGDLIRLSVLRREGGWYFDLDYLPLVPLDRMEQALGLDGSRLGMAAVYKRGQRKHWMGNGVLVGKPGAGYWDRLIELQLQQDPLSKVYGPMAATAMAEKHPDQVTVFPVHRFNGLRHPDSTRVSQIWARHGLEEARKRAGKEVFAVHLWASKHAPDFSRDRTSFLGSLPEDPVPEKQQSTAVILDRRKAWWSEAIATALKKLGYTVQFQDDPDYLPSVVVGWNGYKRNRAKIMARLKKAGVPAIHVENGFIQRKDHIQLDPKGFLHFASWADTVAGDPPDEGFAKLRKLVPVIKPMEPRKQGRVLVIGQVDGDSQLRDVPNLRQSRLQRLVRAHKPLNVEVVYRPHPDARQGTNGPLPQAPSKQTVREYRQERQAGDLVDALRDSRFIITINSNSIIEALIEGVPALALGPCLAVNGVVARYTSSDNMKEGMQAMLDGWVPPQERVEKFLAHLAARQFNAEELARPGTLAPLIGLET